MFPEDLVSIRVGKWKLISNRGGLRDSNWYFERQDGYDRLNSSDTSLVTFLSNAFLDSMESLWETESRVDTIRDLAVSVRVLKCSSSKRENYIHSISRTLSESE